MCYKFGRELLIGIIWAWSRYHIEQNSDITSEIPNEWVTSEEFPQWVEKTGKHRKSGDKIDNEWKECDEFDEKRF